MNEEVTQTKQTQSPAKQATRVVYRKPNYSVHNEDNGYRVDVDLPGITKDQARITLDGNYLIIEADRSPVGQDNWQALRREIPDGTFKLSLELNDDIDGDAIQASAKDGVLTLTLPKAAKAAKRSIAIE